MSIIEEIKQQNQGHSIRKIAKAMNRSRKTIKKYLAENFSENTQNPPAMCWTGMINWDDLHDEVVLRKTPIAILWEEQFALGKCSVLYPAFWKQFTKCFPEPEVTMARQFSPCERIEIDYCDGIEILVPSTGEIIKTHLFMGVLCHSRYVYGEFSFSQKSQDFLSTHVRMFEYFGGTTGIVAPDWGVVSMARDVSEEIFDLFDRRKHNSAMLLTSNQDVSEWQEVFSDPVLASAAIDRMFEDAHVCIFEGPSHRMKGRITFKEINKGKIEN